VRKVAKPGEKVDVEILDVRDVTTYPRPGQAVVTSVITYRAGDLPPRTVFIAKDQDTPENRAKVIRADIDRARAFKPSKLSV